MRIERNYLKEWMGDLSDMIREMEREQVDISSPLQLDGDEKVSCVIASKRPRGSMSQKKPGRMFFKRLYADLIAYAQRESADLLIEENAEHCRIQLEFNMLILDRRQSEEHWRMWSRIIRYADSILFCPARKYGQSIIQYTINFDL